MTSCEPRESTPTSQPARPPTPLANTTYNATYQRLPPAQHQHPTVIPAHTGSGHAIPITAANTTSAMMPPRGLRRSALRSFVPRFEEQSQRLRAP
jgi:hypothetical protein